ncbi:hypothetical protein CYMTET_15258 [Cymbomonas tetramitiformis]|uniref:Uncharacterized protein n=1 Tax=Cymbomonas tetramitiformis TaxID=36881 RepID=A0AAE0L9C1_9CHLO|nr:hypothetical protein CYMTET_15258 [Cymbomonas tetramitiformis]
MPCYTSVPVLAPATLRGLGGGIVISLMARMTTTVVLMFLLGAVPFGTSIRLNQTSEFRTCLLTPPSCTQLDLYANSITGPLPTELGLLTSLQDLHLHDNSITGPLPTELGLLTSLQGL